MPAERPQGAVDVLIAGGGAFGLMLANELGRGGVSAALFDAKPSTAFNPQANATQARTMEHYRRLGFADEVRSLGLPDDFPTDIAYFTRFATHELARFRLPSVARRRPPTPPTPTSRQHRPADVPLICGGQRSVPCSAPSGSSERCCAWGPRVPRPTASSTRPRDADSTSRPSTSPRKRRECYV